MKSPHGNFASKPRRRWQISLKALFLLMVPVAVVAAWLGYEYRQGLQARAAISWVEDRGGWITYDDEATLNNWRRQWFRAWYPESVHAIDLRTLSDLETLQSRGIKVKVVDDLSPLTVLKNLRELGLAGTQVRDLSPLAELENLEELDCTGTNVSSLAPLAQLENLRRLSVRDTQVRDLAPLIRLQSLESLDLHGTPVSPQEVQSLQMALPNCRIYYQ